jgi:polyhydroxyalkanoate synthesis regulator phasin
MGDTQEEGSIFQSVFDTWGKMAEDFGKNMASAWPGGQDTTEPKAESGTGPAAKLFEEFLKPWKASLDALGQPGPTAVPFGELNRFPEVFMQFAQTAWKGYSETIFQVMQQVDRAGKTVSAVGLEDLKIDTMRAWSEIYAKEIRRFFNIPALGLSRFYQERTNRMMDTYTLFQSTFTEFVQLCYVPVEKSMAITQEKIAELAEKGELPKDSKGYYQLWLKHLEAHYLNLFRSPEYIQAMEKTLNTLETFVTARREFLNDLLQFLPVPTQREMDDLYRELYRLKKKVAGLEKNCQVNDHPGRTP